MGNLFAEMKRRHIYRAGAAYAVAAFALIEIVSNVAPMFDLPAWVGRALVLLLIVGFPVTLLMVWRRELPPADGAAARAVTGKVDLVLIGALVVVIGLVSYDRFAPAPGATTAQSVIANGAPTTGIISIAVLPFVNLSSDPEQEFFSDGMTEEITSALAKIKDLRVVGRTSAFEFKGQNKDLRAIGRALSASHLLEGSVRREGNQIRVTAQLIKADDGTHIWTDNYDRELKSVFAIQDEISQAIAGALRIPLGLKQGETLVASRTIDPDNYQQYLRARALFRARGTGSNKLTAESIGLLEQVVEHDPDYAPAWALLGLAYGLLPQFDIVNRRGGFSEEELRLGASAALPKAERAARRAIELDPRNADAYVGLAQALAYRGRWVEAEDLYKQALKLDAFSPDVLHFYSAHLAAVGRVKEAVAMRQQLLLLEPLVPIFNSNTALILWTDGQTDAALAGYKALVSAGNAYRVDMARIYASMGRFSQAADIIAPAQDYPPGVVEAAVRLLRMAPDGVAPNDSPYLGRSLGFIYLYAGVPERALDAPERNVNAGYLQYVPFTHLFHTSYGPARKTARFKSLVRKAGLVDYWRERGWPDLCHPTTGDDFECS